METHANLSFYMKAWFAVCVLPSKHITCSAIIMVSKAFICFLLLLLFHSNHASSTNHPAHCHEQESSALLNFKNSLFIKKSASMDEAYPKTESWNLRSSRDCCKWDGVQCDASSGHVIGLDLSHGCLYGSIDSNNTLFQLLHLQTLNLAYNDFNGSEIPSAVGRLSRLTHLNLSYSFFSGHIPPQVSQLFKLVSLDLSSCILHGEVPGSIGNLKSLKILDISYCGLSGFIPPSMANLTKLTYLSLSNNKFYSQTLGSLDMTWLGKLTQLRVLGLGKLDLKGEIPSSISNLTDLRYMNLAENRLTGRIPLWLGNLTQLTRLVFSGNDLQGLVPASIYGLLNLRSIYIDRNNLSGVLELERFFELPSLTDLDLSGNRFSVLPDIKITKVVPKMRTVGLGSCNLSKFPHFLRNQTELDWLDLSANNIHGEIPKWLWNQSTETLATLSLGFNALTGFEKQPLILPWKKLRNLILTGNRFQGPLLIPPPTTLIYQVGNNSFTGNLPPELCRLTLLYLLDVSDNNLSGIISPCFGNFSNDLVRLYLRGNKFQGIIPQTFQSGGQLRDINFSQNKLRGRLPRSLGNCSLLEILDVSDNQINDSFPHWLGSLPKLKIVNLRANQFHGVIGGLKNAEGFSELRIIDVSQNSFSGPLPEKYFQHWDAMKTSNRTSMTYPGTSFNHDPLGSEYGIACSTGITIKGVVVENRYFLDNMAVIDFSSNRFDGAIPKATANLKGLHSLNLSRNYLTGPIPPVLANLTELKSLDLSQNHLSGKIPELLAGLTSLVSFNVSYNKLSGLIPHGNQFDTFQDSSYLGNSKLCGSPLRKQCRNIQETQPSQTMEKDVDEDSTPTFDWVVFFVGFACGFVVGRVGGCIWTGKKLELFERLLQVKGGNRDPEEEEEGDEQPVSVCVGASVRNFFKA